MGFHTVAIGRGADKEKLAKELGAQIYIDTLAEDAVAALQRMGGAQAILATGTSGEAMGRLVPCGTWEVHCCRRATGRDSIECVSARLRRTFGSRQPDRHAD